MKPTVNPSRFEIELDVIGGTNRTGNKIDVVFVIDKSGSMNSLDRWTNLKTELAKFSKDLIQASFEPGNIKMGLVSFGDNQSGNEYTPYARIADFNPNPTSQLNSVVGFTDDFTRFDASHGNSHQLLQEDPNGGTALFLGVDGGLELLKNASYGARSDARKVLIVLSDGVATYAPRANVYTSQSDFQGKLSRSRQNNNRTLQFSTTLNSTNKQFVGNGQESNGNLLSNNNGTNVIGLTNNFIVNRRTNNINNPSVPILPITIGFGLTGDYSSQAKGILRNLGGSSTTDSNSNFFDAAVDNLGDALDKVKTLILTLNDVVRDGTITDPMSQYVSLIGGTVKTYALTLNTTTKNLSSIATTNTNAPAYAKNAVVDQTVNPLKVTNLYLGGKDDLRYGYRMVYTVELKEAYQDGLFYPANGRTTLTAFNITDPLDFAVPSVRHKNTIDLPIEKIWTDNNNSWDTRQDITLQLQKQVGSNWENIPGKTFTISKNATGNDLKSSFSNLPAYLNGSAINYRIVEMPNRVIGYKKAVYTPAVTINSTNKTLKVTNELAYLPLGKFVKINEGNDKLQGVKFKLFREDGITQIGTEKTSNVNGEVDFSDVSLPVGTYLLKETTTLPGYVTMPDRTITVTDTGTTDVNLVLSGMDDRPNENGNQIVNQLKPFELKVTKEDSHGNALNGAEFTLTPNAGITVTVSGNVFTFKGLKPGTYTLTETKTPNGYIGIEPMTIIVNSKGEVTVDGEVHSVDTTGANNLIKLTIKNRGKGALPSTGGHGTQQYVIGTLVLASLIGVIAVYYVYRNRKEAE